MSKYEDPHMRVIRRDPTLHPDMPSVGAVLTWVHKVRSADTELKHKWGDYPSMVSDLVRAKLDRQRAKLETALEGQAEVEVRKHAEAMLRGFAFVDKALKDAGHIPVGQKPHAVMTEKGEMNWDVGDDIPF